MKEYALDIMKRGYVCFAVPILLIGCIGTSFYVEPEEGHPETLFQSSGLFDPRAEPVQVVIRSPQDWEDFLSIYPTRNLSFARDRFWHVDYNRHMVIGLALGARGSGSITVTIESLRLQNERVVVYASEFRPAIQTRDFANPAHFIVVERMDFPVEFAEIRAKEFMSR